MELTIEQGRGYVPVEARENQKLELGVIGVDAIFTPIKAVHFDVSNVRVGQLTNFDKLEVVMETDGTMTGQEAVDIAAHILVDHFSMVFANDFDKNGVIPTENIITPTEEALLLRKLIPKVKTKLNPPRFPPGQKCSSKEQHYQYDRFARLKQRRNQ